MISDTELALVEDALKRAVVSNVGLLSRAGEHIVLSGGKRLRPRVVLLSFKASGGEDVCQAIPVAAAVELLHTASLVHDDINDRSDLRRGNPTVNAQWGDSLALLAGDFLFIRLLNLIAAFESRVIRVVADSCLALVEGETLQVLTLGDTRMTEETYLRIVGQKTAALFSACAELGVIMAGGARQLVAAFRDYGYNLGVAFQIRDDTLDLVSRSEMLGKPVASDLGQGKMSLATLFALRRSEEARAVLVSDDTGRAIQLLRDTGAIEYAMLKAREYSERARDSLSVVTGSDAKKALMDLADFVVAREV
jgi:geranylgeranyl pyrophosphate synthase